MDLLICLAAGIGLGLGIGQRVSWSEIESYFGLVVTVMLAMILGLDARISLAGAVGLGLGFRLNRRSAP